MKSTEQTLIELEAERAELDAAIAVLRRKLSLPPDKDKAAARWQVHGGQPYRRLSLTKAIKKYASTPHGPTTPRELGEILKEGGIKSKSKHYLNIVRTTLRKQGPELGMRQLPDGRWEPERQPTKTKEEESP